MVQVFLNIVVWGMDPQAAIDAPRFRSENFPDSFSPHAYFPGRLQLEEPLRDRADALAEQGYDVRVLPEESAHEMGAVCTIIRVSSGRLVAGADPREESLALGD
jgi:gamma-glutamyltranspeptidase/glutathione hydrolase